GIGNGLPRRFGDEGHRRNGANIKSANIVFAAQIEAVEGRDVFAAVTGNVGDLGAQSQHIAVLGQGLELLGFENVGDGVDVATDRAAGERKRVEEGLAFGRLLRIVYRVVVRCAGNGAGDNTVERAGAGHTAILDGLEQ